MTVAIKIRWISQQRVEALSPFSSVARMQKCMLEHDDRILLYHLLCETEKSL